MVNWLASHREGLLLAVGCSTVALPFVVGYLLGDVPKRTFAAWVLPLWVGTLLLAVGIRFVERFATPEMKLGIYLVFGSLWLVGGWNIHRTANGTGGPTGALHTARWFARMFLLFGVTWMIVAVYRYFY